MMLQKPGVAGYFGAKDVPGGNDMGAVVHDEECFASKVVTCIGQPIGVVVADTEQHARMAARLVRVEYQDLPALISIEDAIEASSYYEVKFCSCSICVATVAVNCFLPRPYFLSPFPPHPHQKIISIQELMNTLFYGSATLHGCWQQSLLWAYMRWHALNTSCKSLGACCHCPKPPTNIQRSHVYMCCLLYS